MTQLTHGQPVSFQTNTGRILTGCFLGTNDRRTRRNRIEVTDGEGRSKVWNVTTRDIRAHTDFPEED